MNSEVFTTVLCRLNRRLARQNRNILLLMDNATCHPEDINDKLSNIKVVFLPKNTTSRLQPLDAGIIKNFKCHYRALVVKHVIAKIDSQSEATASDIAKSINILMAIQWVKQAWEQVKTTTIINCFTTCGASPDVETADETDPFAELDQSTETAELNELVRHISADITADEYLDSDSDLCTHLTIDPEQMSSEKPYVMKHWQYAEMKIHVMKRQRVKMRFWK